MIDIGTFVNFTCNPKLLEGSLAGETYNYPVSVTFCIYGNNYSSGFFNSWTKLLFFLKENPTLMIPHYSNSSSIDNECMTRNHMIGGDDNQDDFQIPFLEDFDTKYLFWINSDMIFEPLQIIQAIYKMAKYDLKLLTACYFLEDGSCGIIKSDEKEIDYYDKEELIRLGSDHENKLCEVSNSGMNFLCIDSELFQKINYPWFEIEKDYNCQHSFIRKLKNQDVKLYCDTSLIVFQDKNK